ncbi:MAG: hypothetical protein J6Y93_06625, partial [Treponema sp.]|nr:hypothetical protein [Treponema sp.]
MRETASAVSAFMLAVTSPTCATASLSIASKRGVIRLTAYSVILDSPVRRESVSIFSSIFLSFV